jgi:hypothetical protein
MRPATWATGIFVRAAKMLESSLWPTGVEMHDDNESRLDILRQAFEKHLQSMDAAG